MKTIILLIILCCSFVQPIPAFASAVPVERTTSIQQTKQIKFSLKKQKPLAIQNKNIHPLETLLIIIVSLLAIWFFTGLTLLIVGLVLSITPLWIVGTVLLAGVVALILGIIIREAVVSKKAKTAE